MIFLVITFLVDWGIALGFYLFDGKLIPPWGTVMASVFMVVPALVVIVLQKSIYHEPLKPIIGESLKPNRWWLIAASIMPLLALISMVVASFFPGIELSSQSGWLVERFGETLSAEQLAQMQAQLEKNPPAIMISLSVAQAIIAGLTINALFGFGEELGWRGYLYKELSHLGFWRMSMIVGTIWGIWHAPIILMGHNYPDHPIFGVVMMTMGMILLAPLFSFLREMGGSSIVAAIAHGTFNASYGLSVMYLNKDDDLLTGSLGLAGFIVLAMTNIAIFFIRRAVIK